MLATSVAMLQRAVDPDGSSHRVTRAMTYSGIGVVIEPVAHGRVLIRDVIPNSPADGKLARGAYLVKVDGKRPGSQNEWTSWIRGAEGTDVELEVAYHCGGHQTVTLTRSIIRLEY
jgi:C-terminal processing protease CtpA/Prc